MRALTWLLVCCAPFTGSCAGLARASKDMEGTSRALNDAINKPLQKMGDGIADISETLHHPSNEALDPEQEYYLGRAVVAQLLAKHDNEIVGVAGKGKKARASGEILYVQSIAAAVAEAARTSEPKRKGATERRPTTLRVAVVKSEVPNAWATPGGFTVVTTGMLDLAESEDELAAVLAHEMAHISLAHGLAAIDKARLKGGIRKIGEGLGDTVGAGEILGELTGKLTDMVGDITGALFGGYPEDWEYAADQRAVLTLKAAGYEPNALRRVLERLDTWQRDHGQDGIAGTHPPAPRRIHKLGHTGASSIPEAALAVRQARFETHVPALVSAGKETRVGMR